MFIVSNLLQAIAEILSRVLQIYQWIVMIAVLLSWVSPDPFNPVVRILRGMTEPVFDLVRRRLPMAMLGMLDLSPILVLLFIWFAQSFLVRSLIDLSLRLR